MSDVWNSIKDHLNALPNWGKAVLGAVVVGGTVHLIFAGCKATRKLPYKENYKPDVVYVFQIPRAEVIPSSSQYGLKLETWLRMANITYENVDAISIGARSKEGTIPFVELNGVEYDDSSLIIRDLTKFFKKESIDGELSIEQKAISRAFEQMMDTCTFWSFAYTRHLEYSDILFTEKYFGAALPWYLGIIMKLGLIKREVFRRAKAHGIGRHPKEEIINIGLDDLKAISNYLSSKLFLHGDNPTKVDAFLFGYLAPIIYVPLETPHSKFISTECRNLIGYCDRIKAKFWPDWDEICRTRAFNGTWKK